MIYFYATIGFVMGAASERCGTLRTFVIAVAVVALGVLGNTWPYVDWKGGRVSETLITGVVEYSVPAIVFFVAPFLCGKYSVRSLKRVFAHRRSQVSRH